MKMDSAGSKRRKMKYSNYHFFNFKLSIVMDKCTSQSNVLEKIKALNDLKVSWQMTMITI